MKGIRPSCRQRSEKRSGMNPSVFLLQRRGRRIRECSAVVFRRGRRFRYRSLQSEGSRTFRPLRIFRRRSGSRFHRPFRRRKDHSRGLGVPCRGRTAFGYRRRRRVVFFEGVSKRARERLPRYWRNPRILAQAGRTYPLILRLIGVFGRIGRSFSGRLVRHRVGIVPEFFPFCGFESRMSAFRLPRIRREHGCRIREEFLTDAYSSITKVTDFSPAFSRPFQSVIVSSCFHGASSASLSHSFASGFPSSIHSLRSKPIPVTNRGIATCVPAGRFPSIRYRVHPSGEMISKYPSFSASSADSSGAPPGFSSSVTMREKISPAPVAHETPFMFDPSLFPLQTARR